MNKILEKISDQKYYLFYIIVLAVIIRLYYSFGHVFSDDAYFSYLSYTLYNSDFAANYIGYPHTPLRIYLLILTAISYNIFGTTELATMFFPFIFSLGNIILAYIFVKEISGKVNIAILAAFLMAFFPTDITFATINFSDSPASFFINLGLYFLYKSYKNESIKFSVLSGISFFLSIQFKMNIILIGILILIFWVYSIIKSRSVQFYVPIVLSFVGINLLLEGLLYFYIYGDFFYRFSQIELNSQYNIHEFFRLGSLRGYLTKSEYWPALFERLFILNPKDVFLRRFYLFLPVIALFQSIKFIRQKKLIWLSYWFIGLALLFIGFTSSLNHYQPMILRLSWYMFPLFLPAVILSSFFIFSLKKYLRYITLFVYLVASLIMTHYYSLFFKVSQLDELKLYLKLNNESIIYTDHFTKYSVDLIDGYPNPPRTHRIVGSDFDFQIINKGDWILYKREHIAELKQQNHQFPDFSILDSEVFEKIFDSGGFIIYKKIK